jgi:hypothetical protein
MASILSFTFREAVEDVEYQGEGGLQLQLAILIRFVPCSRAVGGSVPVVRSAASELDGGGRVPPNRKGND